MNEAAKAAVLVSSKPGCFIAGADIAWLDSAQDKEEVWPALYNKYCYRLCLHFY